MTLDRAAWWAWWSDLVSQVSDRVVCYPAATCALLIMGGQIVATNAGSFNSTGPCVQLAWCLVCLLCTWMVMMVLEVWWSRRCDGPVAEIP